MGIELTANRLSMIANATQYQDNDDRYDHAQHEGLITQIHAFLSRLFDTQYHHDLDAKHAKIDKCVECLFELKRYLERGSDDKGSAGGAKVEDLKQKGIEEVSEDQGSSDDDSGSSEDVVSEKSVLEQYYTLKTKLDQAFDHLRGNNKAMTYKIERTDRYFVGQGRDQKVQVQCDYTLIFSQGKQQAAMISSYAKVLINDSQASGQIDFLPETVEFKSPEDLSAGTGEYENRLNNANQRVSELESRLRDSEGKILTLKAESQRFRNLIGESNGDLNKTRIDLEKIAEEIWKCEEEMGALSVVLKNKEQERENDNMYDVSTKVHTQESLIEIQKMKVKSLESEVAFLDAEIKGTKGEIRLENIDNELEQRTLERDRALEELGILEGKLEELKERNDKYQRNLEIVNNTKSCIDLCKISRQTLEVQRSKLAETLSEEVARHDTSIANFNVTKQNLAQEEKVLGDIKGEYTQAQNAVAELVSGKTVLGLHHVAEFRQLKVNLDEAYENLVRTRLRFFESKGDFVKFVRLA